MFGEALFAYAQYKEQLRKQHAQSDYVQFSAECQRHARGHAEKWEVGEDATNWLVHQLLLALTKTTLPDLVGAPEGQRFAELHPQRHQWIELSGSMDTTYGKIRGLFFYELHCEQDFPEMTRGWSSEKLARFQEKLNELPPGSWCVELVEAGEKNAWPFLYIPAKRPEYRWQFVPTTPCPMHDPDCQHNTEGLDHWCEECRLMLLFVRTLIPLVQSLLKGYIPEFGSIEEQSTVQRTRRDPRRPQRTQKVPVTLDYRSVEPVSSIAARQIARDLSEQDDLPGCISELLFARIQAVLLQCGGFPPTFFIEEYAEKRRVHAFLLDAARKGQGAYRQETAALARSFQQTYGHPRYVAIATESWVSSNIETFRLPEDDPERGEVLTMYTVDFYPVLQRGPHPLEADEVRQAVQNFHAPLIREKEGSLLTFGPTECSDGSGIETNNPLGPFVLGLIRKQKLQALKEAGNLPLPPRRRIGELPVVAYDANAPLITIIKQKDVIPASTARPLALTKTAPPIILSPGKKPFLERFLAKTRAEVESKLGPLMNTWKLQGCTGDDLLAMRTNYLSGSYAMCQEIEIALKYRLEQSGRNMVQMLHPIQVPEVLTLQREGLLIQHMSKVIPVRQGAMLDTDAQDLLHKVSDALQEQITDNIETARTTARAQGKHVETNIELPLPALATLPGRAVWMEITAPLGSETDRLPLPLPYREEQREKDQTVAAFFFCNPERSLQRYYQQHPPEPELAKRLQHFLASRPKTWSLYVINVSLEIIAEYNYYPEIQRWGLPLTHVARCPASLCLHRDDPHKDHDPIAEEPCVVPCPVCLPELSYWSSWLATALLVVRGVFAHEENEDEPMARPQITEQSTRKVKKPGTGKYEEKAVQNTYYLVSFDATRKGPSTEEKPVDREQQKRGSWMEQLRARGEEVVDVTMENFQYDRTYRAARYINVRNTTQTVKVKKKRVPMKIATLRQRIIRVTASKPPQAVASVEAGGIL